MNKTLALEKRIRKLKPAVGFMVATSTDREQASKVGKNLRTSGKIEFDLVTKKRNGGFVVAAI
jgi:hypothetical protein